MTRHRVAVLSVVLLLAGCGGPDPAPPASTALAPVPPGLPAWEVAGATPLPEREPEELPGLHHVYRLSENVISGAEPHGEEAFSSLAAMGVKTVVSVDGGLPDHEAAAKHGLRYVHVPIHYSGISPDERLRLAKTFRELEGPLYVHCFHGQHRGPAAAALARIVKDGAPRERALAEMRQWCGTAEKYEGLFETIARGVVPSAEDTARYDYDFPPAQTFVGYRQAMVDVSRAWENLLFLEKTGFAPDAAHPDLVPAAEASRLERIFHDASALDEVKDRPEDFRSWMASSLGRAKALREAVERIGTGDDAVPDARSAFAALKKDCEACHQVYRNH